MKRKIKEILIRIVILMVGLTIAHLGVTLFLLTELGADPFNVLIQGLFRTLGRGIASPLLTHGNVHLCICLLIILLLLVVDRSTVRIGTLLCMLFGGPIIDGFTFLLKPLFVAVPGPIFRLIILPISCAVLAFGMTLVIQSEAGTGPNDLVAVVLSKHTKIKFSLMRILVDFSFIGIGFALGGTVGIGTIVCAFLVGPVAGFFMPKSHEIVRHFVPKAKSTENES